MTIHAKWVNVNQKNTGSFLIRHFPVTNQEIRAVNSSQKPYIPSSIQLFPFTLRSHTHRYIQEKVSPVNSFPARYPGRDIPQVHHSAACFWVPAWVCRSRSRSCQQAAYQACHSRSFPHAQALACRSRSCLTVQALVCRSHSCQRVTAAAGYIHSHSYCCGHYFHNSKAVQANKDNSFYLISLFYTVQYAAFCPPLPVLLSFLFEHFPLHIRKGFFLSFFRQHV